ncbi:DUF5906 domain-containing protein [Burkholderia multivorans]|uniref:DUF5906 domain-containing protein n=1 Tax=Burkholderia multivorans TaxID=87883 RepID=UPI000D00E1CF|nr:DUF5906 domain-containing protein [Burkholderia multivorans]PRG51348.1 hypothetical protein C6T62_00020 [Burkholderia multivorans]
MNARPQLKNLPATESDVRAALARIPADIDRDTWARIAMAIKSEFGADGFEMFDAWSQGGASYSATDARDTWRSVKPSGGIKIATLFGIAKEHGYVQSGTPEPVSPAEQERIRRERAERDAKAEAARALARADAATKAFAVWSKATPAADDNPYLARKGVQPTDALREIDLGKLKALIGYTPQADGVYLQGGRILIAPVYVGGKISTLEMIDGTGRKTALAGGAKAGGIWAAQEFTESPATVLVAEGVATALSARECTGHPAIAALSVGNVGKAVAAMQKQFPTAKVIVLADLQDETGEPHPDAVKAARNARVALAVPDFGDDRPEGAKDANDLHQLRGADAVRASVEAATVLANAPVAANDNRKADDASRAIAEINSQHALVLQGNSVVVLRETVGERMGKELIYMSLGAFKAWHMNRTVAVERTDKEGNTTTKYTPIADIWLKSPDRRQFEGVTFAPANNAPGCYYNLWSGFAVEPLECGLFAAALKCRRLLSHAKYNICNGNREHFRYLLAWAADMVQDPDKKKGVALVMRGRKGVGKSTFIEAVHALLGRHAIKVAQARHLTGNFNRHLADKLLVTAEESYWSGDKSSEGALKDMITSSTASIEAKGVDVIEMPSLCRVAMITNNEWAVPASTDERRYFVLDVSDRRRQDFAYFEAIQQQLKDGGLRAFLTVLLRFPLHTINLRQVPETAALRKQRALSLEPHDQFVYDLLMGMPIQGMEFSALDELSKQVVYDAYIQSSRNRGKHHLMDYAQFCKKFTKATGAKAIRGRGPDGRIQVFKFPRYADAVATFSAHCGVDISPDVTDDGLPF